MSSAHCMKHLSMYFQTGLKCSFFFLIFCNEILPKLYSSAIARGLCHISVIFIHQNSLFLRENQPNDRMAYWSTEVGNIAIHDVVLFCKLLTKLRRVDSKQVLDEMRLCCSAIPHNCECAIRNSEWSFVPFGVVCLFWSISLLLGWPVNYIVLLRNV